MSNSSFVFETLDESQLHIWKIPLSSLGGIAKLLTLSCAEQERAGHFIQPQIRDRFIFSHHALRRILACYLQTDPQKIVFETKVDGKPEIRDDPSGIQFNLSHSHQLALVAISKNADVGVDVEKIRKLHNLDAFIHRYLSKSEAEDLSACSPEARLETFFRIWTAKEAYLKALGVGLSGGLTKFDVVFEHGILQIHQNGWPIPGWFVSQLEVGDGYAGAVALQRPATEIRYCEWHDDV